MLAHRPRWFARGRNAVCASVDPWWSYSKYILQVRYMATQLDFSLILTRPLFCLSFSLPILALVCTIWFNNTVNGPWISDTAPTEV